MPQRDFRDAPGIDRHTIDAALAHSFAVHQREIGIEAEKIESLV